ncbi:MULTISPECIES: transposase [unclassified Streptomyces]|uniref:transposase n=1 Tax=unclassified Streptomyces TaxID=2593676 RepID=UPI0016608407|nr:MULTISPECIES: transposase [unclassified Streptomyces]MBD0710411.1 hypothetical protein [Streptomyces sp. CBMA291]MBD0712746.1 hypothetical protein [Streptomyces sp. CBMA370]
MPQGYEGARKRARYRTECRWTEGDQEEVCADWTPLSHSGRELRGPRSVLVRRTLLVRVTTATEFGSHGRHGRITGNPGRASKIRLVCDGRGRPLGFVVTGGDTNGCTRSTAVLEAIRVPRPGLGRSRVHILSDKGYSSKVIGARLRRRGIPHTIPERAVRVRNWTR